MTVQVEDLAPDFTLRDQHGQEVALSQFRGRRAVVLVFYPFAFSRVCTFELGALRDALPTYDNDSVALLAVSCDPMFGLRVFAEQDGLTYPLLSDFWPHGAVARSYGVFNDQTGSARRATFIIDRDGVVRWKVDNALPAARDMSEYEAALAQLVA